jgi:putative ABC transport system permease protein
MVITIRTRGTPEGIAAAIRRTLASIDSNVPIQSLKPFDQWLGATLLERRFVTFLLAIFAGIAVLLAAIGCYGVLNSWVNSRRQEIAIRMTMGAGTFAIFRRTGTQAARLGVLGLAIGLAGSWGASRSISSLVFGIGAHDPMVLGGAALVAMLMVVLAAGAPLWRAVRVNPIESLHEA